VATDSATARQMARSVVGAREKCIIVLANDNTPDRVLFPVGSAYFHIDLAIGAPNDTPSVTTYTPTLLP